MDPVIVWHLNLDAEDELARLGRAYAPSDVVRARIEGLRPRLADLIGDGLHLSGADRFAPGAHGRAWCPTPRALAALSAAGAVPPMAPPAEILRRVAHRRWTVNLGFALPGAIWLDDPSRLAEHLAPFPVGESWHLKRAFAYAGRGHRRVRAGSLSAADQSWLLASEGGVLAEPEVARTLDLSLHGYVHPDGTSTLGVPTAQDVDAGGTWQASRLFTDAWGESAILLRATASAVALALAASRYFGPFGIDAYEGTLRGAFVRQRCTDVNARYTMGWATRMGTWRPEVGLP